jgi:hypothetical protein
MGIKVTKERGQRISSDYGSAIKERLNSPFIGPYVIFVLLWNWESLLQLVLSGHESALAIYGVKQSVGYLSLLVYPLLSTFIYLMTYPLIAGLFDTWRSYANSLVFELSSSITAREDAAMFERVKRLEHGDLTEELQALSEASRELDTEVETLSEKVRKKSAHLTRLTKDREALRADERDTLRQIDDASKENEKNNKTLKTLESDARKRSEANEAQRLELERILKKNSDMNQRLSEAKSHMNLQTKEIESTEHEVHVARDAANSLKGELEKLKLELSKLEQSKLEQSKLEQSKLEQLKLGQSKLEQLKLEQSKLERLKLEQSKLER